MNRIFAISCILIFSIAGCATVPFAHGPADTYHLDFTPPQGVEPQGAFVFVVDGVSGEIFNEMLKKGELPAFKKYFVDRGLYVPTAVGCCPSITLANLTAFSTGKLPGHNNIPSVSWFDRKTLIWRDYNTIAQKNTLDTDHDQPTIFEQFPDDFTVSIFFQPHRGTSKFFENWASAGPPYFFGMYDYVDRLTLHRMGEMMQMSRKREKFPRLVYVYLLMPDFEAYNNGVSSRFYREALKHTDKQLGRVLGDMKRAGILDKVIIAFVSDHSMCEVRKHFSLEEFLDEKCGIKVASRHLYEQSSFDARKKYYDQYDCVTYGNGDRFWALSFRKPTSDGSAPWPQRPDAKDLQAYTARNGSKVNLIDKILDLPAVNAVAWKSGENSFNIKLPGGEAEFSQKTPGGPIKYTIIHGTDPLGWARYGILSSANLTPKGWNDDTHDTKYPFNPQDLLAYFSSGRRGDIAVFAAEGYDFGWKNWAGHGGITPGDLITPLAIAGPGIPHKKLHTARTIDLVPTLLELLKKPDALKCDGTSLLIPAQK